MRYLIAFLKKYSVFLLFVLLEGIAVLWILSSHPYQRSVVASSAGQITGSVFNTVDGVSGYFGLVKENSKLMTENARLRSKLREFEKEFIIFDTLYSERVIDVSDSTQYSFLPAHVINNTVNKVNNFFMIDVGKNDGVTSEMGVVGANGVVGIIVSTSKNYSWVMSLLHGRCRISAKLKNNNMLGSVQWQGYDYSTGVMVDIPSHIKLKMGDTIVTSGFSHMFPQGSDIGTVYSFNTNSGDDMFTIKFKYSEDFKSLNSVYVVKNWSRKEQIELKETTKIYE
ncbi:MAG: rod shape-determining protein MreC [Bacteroidota bacterium]|nr:rod shape-determining protein MreC [Bacteroidota bacterium]